MEVEPLSENFRSKTEEIRWKRARADQSQHVESAATKRLQEQVGFGFSSLRTRFSCTLLPRGLRLATLLKN